MCNDDWGSLLLIPYLVESGIVKTQGCLGMALAIWWLPVARAVREPENLGVVLAVVIHCHYNHRV